MIHFFLPPPFPLTFTAPSTSFLLKQTTLVDLSSSMDQVDLERLKCSR